MSNRRVVVTGLGMIAPVGFDIPTCWDNVLAGKSGIQPITHLDIEPVGDRETTIGSVRPWNTREKFRFDRQAAGDRRSGLHLRPEGLLQWPGGPVERTADLSV